MSQESSGEKRVWEDNPFNDETVAREWINSVENEKDLLRDKEIYPTLRSWAAETKPETVVEIGSGQGICADKLDYPEAEYTGIEPSSVLVDRAKELYKRDNREFLVGNAYELPLPAEYADASFSVNVWFHLEDLNKAGKELARILKEEGKFLIITANPEKYGTWKSFYFDYVEDGKKLDGKVNVPVNSLSRNIFYRHTMEEINISLENAGLKIESVRNFGGAGENGDAGMFIEIKGHKKSVI